MCQPLNREFEPLVFKLVVYILVFDKMITWLLDNLDCEIEAVRAAGSRSLHLCLIRAYA